MNAHALVIYSINGLFIEIRPGQLSPAGIVLLVCAEVSLDTSKQFGAKSIAVGQGTTHQTMHGVHVHVAGHLVPVSSDVPGTHRPEVRKAVELVIGALRQTERIRLAALDEVGLAGGLVRLPEISILHLGPPVFIGVGWLDEGIESIKSCELKGEQYLQ